MSEADSKALLHAYGIPVTETRAAGSAAEAVQVAGEIGYPVVLKVRSRQITHKTDVGGVILGVRSDEEVRTAYRQIEANVLSRRPDAVMEGVTVQRMVTETRGIELILGARKDASFGAVIMLGMGGVAAEVLRDRVLGLPPLNDRLTRRMIEFLRAWPLLQGYRGRPGVDLERLSEVLVRFSHLVADHPGIAEIDVNPLVATADGVIALDARIVPDRTLKPPFEPYAHLAIRPTPDWRRECRLNDGSEVALRIIRPEDEPRWRDFIAACSEESLYARFQASISAPTHQMAARFCFIDYDREMALVAEVQAEGDRRIVGVGRMVADPDRQSAELAFLVADAWQGKGLGELLADACLDLARDWGVAEVTAQTDAGNRRMLAIFRERGFESLAEEERVCVRKAMTFTGPQPA